MKPLEIKAARVRCGIKSKEMAKILGLKPFTYSMKENGNSPFTIEEVVTVGETLGLTMEQINDFFFDGILPLGK